MSKEISRRSVRIRLVPNQEKPWERPASDFKHPDLRWWVKENRGQLVWAALVLIQSWVVAGMPRSARRLGSFEQWSEVMGGILENAGIAGFLENRENQHEALDVETNWMSLFVQKWHKAFGTTEVSARQLYESVAANMPESDLSGRDDDANVVSLGKLLGSHRDAIYAGLRVAKVPAKGHHAARWKVMPV